MERICVVVMILRGGSNIMSWPVYLSKHGREINKYRESKNKNSGRNGGTEGGNSKRRRKE
jgi:hypothetical protein